VKHREAQQADEAQQQLALSVLRGHRLHFCSFTFRHIRKNGCEAGAIDSAYRGYRVQQRSIERGLVRGE
jgi:hypothetical protein